MNHNCLLDGHTSIGYDVLIELVHDNIMYDT